MNRPETGNAMDATFMAEYRDLMQTWSCHPNVRAIVITGSDRFFCGGGDLKSFSKSQNPSELQEQVNNLADILHEGVHIMSNRCPPVVAAINGIAAGAGLSLAMACDLAVASKEATLTSAYSMVGFPPDGSSTWFAAKDIGLKRAKELFLLNRTLNGQEALEWGMVNRLVPADQVLPQAMEMARQLAQGPTSALIAAKQLMARSYSTALFEQMDAEGRELARHAAHPDGQEGIQAFAEKRRPKFRGKDYRPPQ